MAQRSGVSLTVAVLAAALIWLGVAAGAGAEATGGEHRPLAGNMIDPAALLVKLLFPATDVLALR